MPSKIRVLDEHTINKIAAGEVIENPASVVKELVENSIDASSTDICIEIKGGGRQLIRVTDNGLGMSHDDALLCLERHATSKIRQLEDIYEVDTMGFRGEAIPSIASISKFMLITAEEEHKGTMVVVEGGKLVDCSPVIRSKGTTIEVKSLFFNVPVRRKFQKAPAYDLGEVLKILTAVALGHPYIHFQLIADQKTVFNTRICSHSQPFMEALEQRIKDVIGTDFIETSLPLFKEKEKIEVKGFIGLPAFTRPNRKGQLTFVNERAVYSPAINFAVRGGYGTTLSTNRHPQYVLHIKLPSTLVDANVHPQKREVRLRQEQQLRELIMETVQQGLQQVEKNTYQSVFEELPVIPIDFIPKFDITQEPIKVVKSEETRSCINVEQITIPQSSVKIKPEVIGIQHKYIFVNPHSLPEAKRCREGVCIVDTQAALSRVIYERLMHRSETSKVEQQLLLIPYQFSLSIAESELLQRSLDEINQQGISIHQTGPQNYQLDALPPFLANTSFELFIGDLIKSLAELPEGDNFKVEKQKGIAKLAAASSKMDFISLEAAHKLLQDLFACEMPYFCPKGKATLIVIAQDELKDRFNI